MLFGLTDMDSTTEMMSSCELKWAPTLNTNEHQSISILTYSSRIIFFFLSPIQADSCLNVLNCSKGRLICDIRRGEYSRIWAIMVLEPRENNKSGDSVLVDYIVYIQEIKPWPPSHSLRSLRSVFLRWENIANSGSTRAVIPSDGSGVGDGKIKFNESFKLPVTLSKEASMEDKEIDAFQNNYLEFNLYDPQRDKTVKDQLLGTFMVDLEKYGDLKRTVTLSSPMNFKRGLKTATQPVLFIKIQAMSRRSVHSSSRYSLSKGNSFDKDGGDLMNQEYMEEAEVPSSTDDDLSTGSSPTISSVFEVTGVLPHEESISETDSSGRGSRIGTLPQESETVVAYRRSGTLPQESETVACRLANDSPYFTSSIDLSYEVGTPEDVYFSVSKNNESEIPSLQFSPTSICSEGAEANIMSNNRRKGLDRADLARQVHEKIVKSRNKFKENTQQLVEGNNTNYCVAKVAVSDIDIQPGEKTGLARVSGSVIGEEDNKALGQSIHVLEKGGSISIEADLIEREDGERWQEKGREEQSRREKNHSIEGKGLNQFPSDAIEQHMTSSINKVMFIHEGAFEVKGNTLTSDKLTHVKSVQSLLDSARTDGLIINAPCMEEIKKIDILVDPGAGDKSIRNKKKDVLVSHRDGRRNFFDGKVQQLEFKIEKLERELREAAAVEISLYSVVVEHGSSTNKFYAPARRLSRFYFHACKHGSASRTASAAKSAVSGMVIVTNACANDIPRLTFWLSNLVVLRASVCKFDGNLQPQGPSALHTESIGFGNSNHKISSSLKQKVSSPRHNRNKKGYTDKLDDWEDPNTFTTALEKIEAWIFSRIVESVWWQTFSPHMQSASANANPPNKASKKKENYKSQPSFCDQEQAKFSLELWKKAFKDAREKLCPARAGGIGCACLPALARLIVEQCVNRLDVAMFNAFLRESAEETDPVSDPISNSKVLPIPAGKSSFGSGAQLKNVIGNWSRCVSDLFDVHENESKVDELKEQFEEPFKFHHLSALSHVMMIPKDMILNKLLRKEVCPSFSAPLIKKVLNKFTPDEFCPDQIPEAVFAALDSEDLEDREECMRWIPVEYLPPSAASLASELTKSKSSVLRRCHSSDDELNEIAPPVIFEIFSKPKGNAGGNSLKYQLLQEVWRDVD